MAINIKHPNGLDLDDIFAITNTGGQQTGFLSNLGVDIGSRYMAGKANIPDTMLRTSDGVDIKNKFSGSLQGIFRPTGWPWNTGIDQNDEWWKTWVDTWEVHKANAIQVDGVLDDCIYRSCHSSHRYSMAVFVYNPFMDAEVELEYEETYHSWWHNSGSQNRMDVSRFTVNGYLKGLIFRPTSGAGGGTVNIFKITAYMGSYGPLHYEACMGFANDSNNPVTGSSAGSQIINGKKYTFYQG